MAGSPEAIERIQRSPVHYFQRPDAKHSVDPTRTRLSGSTSTLSFSKVGGGNWRYGAFAENRSPGFDSNDLGFQQAADYRIGAAWLSYQQFRPQGPFRRWGSNAAVWSGWTFGGERQFSGGNVNGNVQFKNFWNAFAGFNQELAGLSTTALRGGAALYQPSQWSAWGGMFTDARKPVRLGGFVNAGGEYATATRRLAISPTVILQASSRLQLDIGPNIRWNDQAAQYVARPSADDGTHYVFARLSQQTVSLTTRLNYTFGPDLSLQFYGQPFVSAGSYDRFMEVNDPRAAAFHDRFRTYGEAEIHRVEANGFGFYEVDANRDGTADFGFADRDFNVKSFRSNLVLRWQYRPGSTVFLVWSRDQQSFVSDGAFHFRQDLADIAQIPSTNVFLVKFEHWLGL